MTPLALRLMRWREEDREPLEALIDAAGDSRARAIDLPEIPGELDCAKALIDGRRLRQHAFGASADLFHDPAWDILLQLFVAHEEGTARTIAALSVDPRRPPMVTRRWILAMEQRALVTCWPVAGEAGGDGDDRHVGLTEHAVGMLLNYLAAI